MVHDHGKHDRCDASIVDRSNDTTRGCAGGSGEGHCTAEVCPNANGHVQLDLADSLAAFEREAKTGVVDTGRYRCRYYEWGSGPPILFLHGASDDARSFVLPISLLSRLFRCVAYDLPSGLDDQARLGSYRHDHLVEDALTLVDHLGLKQSYLLGASFGSTIALRLAHAEPRRFPRLVLQGGFARRPLFAWERHLGNWARYWSWPMAQLPFRQVLLEGHRWAFSHCPPDRWQYFVDRWNRSPVRAVARRGLLLKDLDLRPLLPSIRQPTLVVAGEHDPIVGKDCERDLLAGLPHVARAELEGCGHNPQFSHPEVFAEVVRRFLTPPE